MKIHLFTFHNYPTILLIMLLNTSVSYADNTWATGEIYKGKYESYQFAPALKSVPKQQVQDAKNIIQDKGNTVIIHDPNHSNQEASNTLSDRSLPSQAVGCGHCQVLWNKRTQQYAILYPTVIIAPQNEDNSPLTDALDKITNITYQVLPIFIEVTILDMTQWSTTMQEINKLGPIARFIEPQIIENFSRPQ